MREAAAILTSTAALSFSQMRGTAKKRVGWTSRMLMVTVSIDSAKCTTAPETALVQVVTARSATWQSGR